MEFSLIFGNTMYHLKIIRSLTHIVALSAMVTAGCNKANNRSVTPQTITIASTPHETSGIAHDRSNERINREIIEDDAILTFNGQPYKFKGGSIKYDKSGEIIGGILAEPAMLFDTLLPVDTNISSIGFINDNNENMPYVIFKYIPKDIELDTALGKMKFIGNETIDISFGHRLQYDFMPTEFLRGTLAESTTLFGTTYPAGTYVHCQRYFGNPGDTMVVYFRPPSPQPISTYTPLGYIKFTGQTMFRLITRDRGIFGKGVLAEKFGMFSKGDNVFLDKNLTLHLVK